MNETVIMKADTHYPDEQISSLKETIDMKARPFTS